MSTTGPSPKINNNEPNKLGISVYSAFLFAAVLAVTQYVPMVSGYFRELGVPLIVVQTLLFFLVVYMAMKPWEKN
jgi:hypothetical protein|tara:strand:+ start:3690 stop:3914 length:225 start_codon:yes stop_codon:yes gene_type:complete